MFHNSKANEENDHYPVELQKVLLEKTISLEKKNIKNIIYREQQGVRDRKTVKICFSPARSVCMASPPCPNQAEHPSLGALRNWPLDENSWEREQGPFGCAPVAL